jgi:uncharacterized membrane protein
MRADTRRAVGVPAWVPWSGIALSVAGLAVSIYLTVEHYTASTTLACPDTGVVNCQKVTSSPQSAVFGLPVVWLGLAFFAAMLVANLPALWRSHRPVVRQGRVALGLAGVGFVIYLIYAELFLLDAICLWCTAVHVLTVALFAVIAVGTALDSGP